MHSQNTHNKNAQGHLCAKNVTLAYDNHRVCENLEVEIPQGKFTVIIGPNGCGKSTLLKSLCKVIQPQKGNVLFQGNDINTIPAKRYAQSVGLLAQSSQAPDSLSVQELVSRGRYPYLSMLRQWSEEDELAVQNAMDLTDIQPLASRDVSELSGGQRQRVWVAMLLAQETDTLLLDEPTTYLDVSHQLELLDLFQMLNKKHGKTVVAVLHDLNHACRYADHLIFLKGGQLTAKGTPDQIINKELIQQVFGIHSKIIPDPVTNTPMVIPVSAK